MYFYEHLSKCKNIFYRAPVFGFIHTEYFLRGSEVGQNECHRILNACGFCATHCCGHKCGCLLIIAPLVQLFKSLIYFYLFFIFVRNFMAATHSLIRWGTTYQYSYVTFSINTYIHTFIYLYYIVHKLFILKMDKFVVQQDTCAHSPLET